MTRKVFECVLPCLPDQVWDFHADVRALEILTPPGAKVEVVGAETKVVNGAVHRLKIKKFGLPMVWVARISEVEPPHRFVDTAEQSPFAAWRHEHEFLPHPQGTLLRDTIEYALPLGPLGQLLDGLLVSRDVTRMFAHRHRVTLDHLHARTGERKLE